MAHVPIELNPLELAVDAALADARAEHIMMVGELVEQVHDCGHVVDHLRRYYVVFRPGHLKSDGGWRGSACV